MKVENSKEGGASDLQFAMVHVGARLHYAVPEVLAAAGMLKVMFTDAHAGLPLVRLTKLVPPTLRSPALRRLQARHIPKAISPEHVRPWVYPTFQNEWFNRKYPDSSKLASFAFEKNIGGHWLAKKAIAENFGGANAFYALPCICTEAVREAKRRGLFVVYEAISHPFNMRTQKEEYQRLELPLTEGMDCIEENIKYFAEEAALADVVLAASEYVKRGLVELGIAPERIAVVPYGLDADFIGEEPKPVPGRLLYVGTIDAHKGMAYYAEAARALQAEGFKAEFRTIGPFSSPDVPSDPAFRGLDYVGQVPRAEVKREFARADVFVFPTLTDGFGMVLLEALFAGLPIISTPNCGDVVRDGFNGLVVPSHNAEALASAVREIVLNRALRDRMSENAFTLKKDFTLETYQDRLVLAIRDHAARRKG